ncbi:MAG TPA: VCBS repeat-containing protein, partial [Phycisphaerae bacterium]|nr:VCBS repeat-containing protein [Phycisphaerae bacterium]
SYLSHPLGELIRQHVIAKDTDWSCYRIYQKDYKLKPPQEGSGVSFDSVLKAWQDYRPGVVCWMGHGTSVRARNLFHGNQAPKLDDTQPVINFHASCTTGQPEKPMNLGTCMLRNGAVTVVCGTRVTYANLNGDYRVSSGDEGNAFRFTENIVLRRMSVASALNEARSRIAPRSFTSLVNAYANNVYGCPAISIYSHRPTADGTVAWFPDYPKAGRQDEDGFDVHVRSDREGKAYYVVLDKGAAKPTIAQVKTGQDAAGKSISKDRKGTISLVPYERSSGRVDSLASDTQYDIYVVAEGVESSTGCTLAKTIATTGPKGTTFGSVLCKITPPQASEQGAKWRLTTGPDLDWKLSGEIIENLPPTKDGYSIEFSEVSVWDKPASITKLAISDGTVTSVDGVYKEDDFEDNDTHDKASVITAGTHESLKCVDDDWYKLENIPANKKITITLSSSAKWLSLSLNVWNSAQAIDEKTVLATGLRSEGTLVAVVNPTISGDYFFKVAGIKFPFDETVSRSDYKMTIVIGNAELGEVICTIKPDSANKAGAQWRFTTGEDTDWHRSGYRATAVAAGAMQRIEFKEIAGHHTPAVREVVIGIDKKLNLMSTYGIVAVKTAVSYEEQAVTLAKIEKGNALIQPVDLDHDGDMDIIYANTVQLGREGEKGLTKLFWLASDGAKKPSFTKHVINNKLDGYVESLSVIDINKDGKEDILVCDMSNNRILLYANNGDEKGPSFTEHVLSSMPLVKSKYISYFKAVVADVDGDGDLDVLSCSSPGGMVWHENDGAKTPSFKDHLLSSEGTSMISVADIDGDGDLDIVSRQDKLVWYENDGKDKPSFKKSATIFSGRALLSSVRYVTTVDMDGDGDLDVLATMSMSKKMENGGQRYKGGQIAWFENIAGDGSAWVKCNIAYDEGARHNVYAMDVDGDGDLDVLSLTDKLSFFPDPSDKISWHDNISGDGTGWVNNTVMTRKDNSSLSSIFSVDIDGDGHKDLIYGESSEIIWFRNNKALAGE